MLLPTIAKGIASCRAQPSAHVIGLATQPHPHASTHPQLLVGCSLLLLVTNGVWKLVDLDAILLDLIQDLTGT